MPPLSPSTSDAGVPRARRHARHRSGASLSALDTPPQPHNAVDAAASHDNQAPQPARSRVRAQSQSRAQVQRVRTRDAAPAHHYSPSQQIYVLSADGSSLFLLDPSKPPAEEQPPAYHSIHSPRVPEVRLVGEGGDGDGDGDDGLHTAAQPAAHTNSDADDGVEYIYTADLADSSLPGPSSPRHSRSASRQSHHSIHSLGGHRLPTLGSSASLLLPSHPHSHSHSHHSQAPEQHGESSTHGTRQRAATTSSFRPPPGLGPGGSRTRSAQGHVRPRPPQHSTSSPPYTIRTVRIRAPSNASASARMGTGTGMGMGSQRRVDSTGEYGADENTTLLPRARSSRGMWREIWCAGTLAGTALLITLPIGAAVWWLTLIIARTAARLEISMQRHHHPPLPHSARQGHIAVRHPIFHRVKERSAPPSPLAPSLSGAGGYSYAHVVAAGEDDPYARARAGSGSGSGSDEGMEEGIPPVEWEKRFIKCSYAMFCDHYSYSALSYFLLIKPLITLFSSIALVVLLPIAVATVAGLPVYLRAMRRWGIWQAGVAFENL